MGVQTCCLHLYRLVVWLAKCESVSRHFKQGVLYTLLYSEVKLDVLGEPYPCYTWLVASGGVNAVQLPAPVAGRL